MKIRVISNHIVWRIISVGPGLDSSSPGGMQADEQHLELLDAGGNVVVSTTSGRCVEGDCPDGIYNMNYHVLGLAHGNIAGNGCVSIAGGRLDSGGTPESAGGPYFGDVRVPFAVSRGAQSSYWRQ